MAMKRERKSTPDRTQTVNSDRCITDLPTAIIVNIILKQPILSIIACKRVCKAWHGLISSPDFAKLHLERSHTVLLFKESHFNRASRSLYLVEPEDGCCSFDLGLCWCEASSEAKPETKCDRCSPKKVNARLRIPLRNSQVIFDHLDHNPNAIFSFQENKRKSETKNLVNLGPRNRSSCDLVRFCNGFLCLGMGFENELVVICNPITAEFLYLPNSCLDDNSRNVKMGFGYGPKTNKYKLLRIYIDDPTFKSNDEKAEILTVGTDSWRSVDISAFKQKHFSYDSTYFNGSLHWILSERSFQRSQSLVSFHIDDEKFVLYPEPSLPTVSGVQGLGLFTKVLRGSLCMYYHDDQCKVHIWAMKEYGVSESWTKLFCINMSGHLGVFRPLSYMNNGALLMYNDYWKELVYYDESSGLRFKHLKYDGFESYFSCFAYTPSFVSLKEIASSASDVQVLNINSRFEKIKFLEETYPVFLVGGINS